MEPELAKRVDVEVAAVELEARNVEAWDIWEKCELACWWPWEVIVPWKLARRVGAGG
jgi:hypothetical protein